MSRMLTCQYLLLIVVALITVPLTAGEPNQQDRDLFEIHVRPTLVAHCIRCHGETKQEGELQLTSFEALLKGGESGPAIVPGKPNESLLIEAMKYESFEMPPTGQLEKDLVVGIEKWITAGAKWPKGVVLKPTPKITSIDREWWCYQPIADPAVPQVEDDGWCRTDIDRFIYARLASAGVKPSAPAEPAQLLRRTHLAITGLPVSDALLATQAEDIDFDAVVDQLLDSPAYGQNQARLWLDLVRYADSDGYRADHPRPNANKYRDYVIRSFDADKPYDRFVLEQIAGDELFPGNRDAIIGTMYLRHWIYEWNQRDVETQWDQILNDVTETTSDVFLAQGLKCARCHDHKFDPLLHEDFYRLKAFFAPLKPREDMPVADLATREEHFKAMQTWEEKTEDIRRRLYEIERPELLKHATGEGIKRFISEIQAMIAKRSSERTPYEEQIVALASRQFKLHPDKLPTWLDEKLESERQELLARLEKFNDLKPPALPTQNFVAGDVGPISPPTHIPDHPESVDISPGFPTIIDPSPAEITPPSLALQSTGRRTALAKWIVDPKNPLTARVIVNRIWQQHFGRGLVETSSDFGRLGQPPSHPELLDWLASRFVEDGWSIKKLHRRILTSAVYRQSSRRPVDDHLEKVDPANKLLWRMNSRRLTGEEITDTILTASGELSAQKRAIYKTVRRNKPDALLALFDMPDRIRSTGVRHQTTTPTQALLLMNGDWSRQRATAMARKLNGAIDTDFVQQAYLRLYGRQASPVEAEMATAFLESFKTTISTPTPEKKAPALVEMPHTGGKALVTSPDSSRRVSLPTNKALPKGDFTIEAVVLLKSLYKDATVRTIATQWTGNQKNAGWSLGVTSEKSAYKPRNLILQFIGKTANGAAIQYEVVASNLRPELNKPYYVAASVDLDTTGKEGVTFYLRDLSSKDAPLQTANVAHKVIAGINSEHPFTVGSRSGSHEWDGLIDSFRIYDSALPVEKLSAISGAAKTDETDASKPTIDWQFEKEDALGVDSSGNGNHASVFSPETKPSDPKLVARAALLHTLFNSNELIYVD